MEVSVVEQELRVKAEQAIKEMNKLTASAQGYAAQLANISNYLDQINKKSLSNINKQINNVTHSNNIANQNIGTNYDFGNHRKAAKSSTGAVMVSDTGREKVFRDYEQAIIDETIAIRKDIERRTKLRKQRADAELVRNQNTSAAIAKREDKSSQAYSDRQDMLAQAQLLRARAAQQGALNRNWKYQAGRGLQNLGGIVGGIGTGGRMVGLGLDTAGAMLKAPALGATAAITNLAKGISDLSKEAVKSFAEIESIKTQLGVVFSNQTQADSVFGDISQYAVKSPFGVQQTSELAVLLKQSGVYASDLMNTLKMIGDTAGGNMEKMKRIANNYAQIVSIGKASMLDMRQFAYAGIPIFEAVSKELGVSQQELRKLISDGKVTSDIIEKVFKDLTGINGIFENATEKGAKTLKARLQNLQDAKQLAFSEGGQLLTNFGAKTGNDSFANKFVTWAENFYQYVKDNINTKNIQTDVAIIARRNDRIETLKQLIKETDKKELKETYRRELEQELKKIDLDAERNKYALSYDSKMGRLEKAYEALSGYSVNDPTLRLAALNLLSGPQQGRSYASLNQYSEEYKGMSQSELEQLSSLFKELVDAINANSTLTNEDIKANRERNLIAEQQLAFDQENKRADQTNSLNSKFQELYELYKGSDEYQKKEEDKKIKSLTEAKEVLKQLVPKADENGLVDMSKFSMLEFQKYDAQGAFVPGGKFDVVRGNNPTNKEDMAALRSQFTYAMSEASKYLNLYDSRTSTALTEQLKDLNSNLDDNAYLDKFSETFNAVRDIMNVAKVPGNVRNQILGWITSATMSHEVTVGGENANPNDVTKGPKFVPLWERILSGATGLTTNGMTDTLSTMANYRDDMAVRNMTSGVLTATMKSMGIDKAMSLMRTKSAVQLAGDSGKTFQIDWQATKKAIKDFSTQLSASTEVITAYKKGLEDELNTYEQLVAAGYTQAESTDLGSQKFVSTKKLEQLALGNSSQLVNAFGEVIKTKSGKTYKTSEITFDENGRMLDSLGNEIAEEVEITGNLFEFIKGELPRLRKEYHEATVSEINNKFLNKMLSQVSGTSILAGMISKEGISDATNFVANNPDYAEAILRSSLVEKKGKFSSLKELSIEDILSNYSSRDLRLKLAEAKGDKAEEGRIKDSIKLVEDSLSDLGIIIQTFIESPVFQGLRTGMANQNRDNAVMSAYISAKQYASHGLANPDETQPRYYEGERGKRNRLFELFTGTELKYDREDYIAQAVKDPEFRKKINAQRREASIEDRRAALARGDENYGIELLPEDNESILKMTNEELAKMLTTSEQIAVTWEKSSGELAEGFQNIGKQGSEIFRSFASSAITSTFETWGKYLGDSSKASEEIEKNLVNLSSGLMKNMGSMLTQAGLSLAISSIGDKKKVIAGLAIAAAGGGLSFLGGMLDQDNDDNKEDDTYQKLLKVKQDLADLLKQAREDAIYYENTVRHKKAISANDYLTKSVHDAIITPRGDVVTTDPKDYLIATKTPRTLVGGGAPTINFNVIDKSTGIKVTQQKSTYNEETNSIDFEAVIESKVQEVIATSKGDEAFAARQARLNGRTVVA